MMDQRWSIRAALGIESRPQLVAFVGGGGKTSLMFALAAELPGRTLVTTTTRIFATQMGHAPAVIDGNDLSHLSTLLDEHGWCLLIGRVEGEKALGIDPRLPARLLAQRDVDYVLVEADGSRMRPVKAPAGHEPVVPPETTLLVPVAGMDALDGPIEEVAHRPEKIREIANYGLRITNKEQESAVSGRSPASLSNPFMEGGRLTPAGLARVLTHPNGGLKSAPSGARVVPFLNKVETEKRLHAAREAAGLMLAEPRVSRVVLGALNQSNPIVEVWRRVRAIVLAAGESSRMGRNKLLLPWGDATVLGRTLANVKASGVADVLMVSGHEPEPAETIAGRLGIPILYNQDYAKGMITSVQTAVRDLPSSIDAVLVVLGDQPMVGSEVLDELLRAYAGSPCGLIAPTYRGQRGNPVLIDRRYFRELLSLSPRDAPLLLLQRHPDDLHLVEVTSDAILHDLDRPADYERQRPR